MSTTITAKFKCIEKAEREPWGGNVNYGIKFAAATGPGNESWSKATPSGTLEIWVTNPTAADAFVVGQEYMLTFEPAWKTVEPGVAA